MLRAIGAVLVCSALWLALGLALAHGHGPSANHHVARDAEGAPIEGARRLHFAARVDDAGLLGKLLAAGETPAARNGENGATPLHVAAYFGALRAARMLLYGAADGAGAGPALVGAALLELPDAHGARPLHYAAARGSVAMLRLLLAAGADPAAQTRAGTTPLYDAARNGAHAAVAVLAAAAPQTLGVRAYGTTPLFAAAALGEEGAAEALLEAGAAVGGAQNADGWTPLHAAAARGHIAVAAVLLEYGARADEPSARASGATTPLHIAVHNDQQAAYGMLRASARGAAAAAARDASGQTPRELAAALGYTLLH